jgi:predicted nuclease of predicted toxin-antitoxin system
MFPDVRHIAAVIGREADDSTILGYADRHGLTIVTKDSDFVHRAGDRGRPPKIIFVATGNGPWREVALALERHRVAIETFVADSSDLLMEID